MGLLRENIRATALVERRKEYIESATCLALSKNRIILAYVSELSGADDRSWNYAGGIVISLEDAVIPGAWNARNGAIAWAPHF